MIQPALDPASRSAAIVGRAVTTTVPSSAPIDMPSKIPMNAGIGFRVRGTPRSVSTGPPG